MGNRVWVIGRGTVLIHRSVAGFDSLSGRCAGVLRGGLSVVLAVALLVAGAAGVRAHGGDGHPMDKFQAGQVTGKTDRSVRIDGREYALHPKVVMEDDEGRPLQLQHFTTDKHVRYQLKDDRVKQLILVTPK